MVPAVVIINGKFEARMTGKNLPSYFLSALFLTYLVVTLLGSGCIQPANASSKSLSPVDTAPPTIVTTPDTTDATLASPFYQYSNYEYGFSIDYPAEWQSNELNTQNPYYLERYDIVEFYSPIFKRCNTDKSDCVKVRSEVKVEVDTTPWLNSTFFVNDVVRITTEDLVEITRRDATFKISGDVAYRLDYVTKADTGDIKTIRIYTIQNDKIFIITFHAHSPVRTENIDQYQLYYNDAMTMFASFKMNEDNLKII
jgi:hypothetical protein